jgi:hypothetical protein
MITLQQHQPICFRKHNGRASDASVVGCWPAKVWLTKPDVSSDPVEIYVRYIKRRNSLAALGCNPLSKKRATDQVSSSCLATLSKDGSLRSERQLSKLGNTAGNVSVPMTTNSRLGVS